MTLTQDHSSRYLRFSDMFAAEATAHCATDRSHLQLCEPRVVPLHAGVGTAGTLGAAPQTTTGPADSAVRGVPIGRYAAKQPRHMTRARRIPHEWSN